MLGPGPAYIIGLKYHKNTCVKKNLEHSYICFIKGSAAKSRLFKNTFKPLGVEIPTN